MIYSFGIKLYCPHLVLKSLIAFFPPPCCSETSCLSFWYPAFENCKEAKLILDCALSHKIMIFYTFTEMGREMGREMDVPSASLVS